MATLETVARTDIMALSLKPEGKFGVVSPSNVKRTATTAVKLLTLKSDANSSVYQLSCYVVPEASG